MMRNVHADFDEVMSSARMEASYFSFLERSYVIILRSLL